MGEEDWWLVLCREHGPVATALETELAAHRAADEHERPGCDLRVLTEDQWEQLKRAGKLRASTGPSTILEGP